MQAVLQRDADQACRLLTEHITGTADRVASSLGG
jgi:DNA-binding GntR family transcriptional regulator